MTDQQGEALYLVICRAHDGKEVARTTVKAPTPQEAQAPFAGFTGSVEVYQYAVRPSAPKPGRR